MTKTQHIAYDERMDGDNPAPETTTPVATDKVETQANEADVQVTTETPEASQTQEEQQSDVNAEDKGVEEKLYAGTFKNPDELEKAYQELRSKSTKDAMEKAELSRLLTSAFDSPAPTQVQNDSYDEYEQPNVPDPRDVRMQQLETQSAIQSFILTHNDVDVSTLDNVLKNDPLVNQITTPQAKLEYAYLRSQNMSKQKAIEEATSKAITQTQAKVVEKQAAQVEQVQRSQQPDPKAERAQRIMQGDRRAIEEAFNEIPAVQQMKRMAGLSE